MTIKGIVCDFGGVLVLFNDQGTRAKWAARLGMDQNAMIDTLFNSKTSLDALTGQINEDELWEFYRKQFALSKQEISQFRSEIFIDDRLNIELLTFLSTLPPTLKKAILSNAWLSARQVFTEKFHLDKVFDLIVISAEEGIVKPDDEIYYRTAERLGLNPWELIFIDDMQVNTLAAAKVSMAAIHFQDTKSTIRQITTLLISQGVAVL